MFLSYRASHEDYVMRDLWQRETGKSYCDSDIKIKEKNKKSLEMIEKRGGVNLNYHNINS